MSGVQPSIGGGAAVNGEYSALLGLPVTEATVRRAIRYNPSVREALRAALKDLPEVAAAAPSATLEKAAELSRGADSQKSTGELYGGLCAAAQGRVRTALGLPACCKTWEQVAARCKVYGAELLCNTVVTAEFNQEVLAQSPEALASAGEAYARLSEAGRVKVVSKCSTFGLSVMPWAQLAKYAAARNEAAELRAVVNAMTAKERQAAAKAAAAAAAPVAGAAGSPPLANRKADVHTKRTTNHSNRRTDARKS